MKWLVCDTLYNREAFTCGHLDSYAHYISAMGEDVERHDWAGLGLFRYSGRPVDVVFALDRYAEALKIPARVHIAQVACDTEIPPGYDAILSSIPALVEKYKARGENAIFQHLCFDTRARAYGMGVEKDLDCIFLGSMGHAHQKRMEMLHELSDVVTVVKPCFGAEMFRTLARARAVFNVHADWAAGAANNMRMWETVGMGTALVSDGDSEDSPSGWYFKDVAEARADIEWALREDEQPFVNAATRNVLMEDTYIERVPFIVDLARSL